MQPGSDHALDGSCHSVVSEFPTVLVSKILLRAGFGAAFPACLACLDCLLILEYETVLLFT